MKRVVKFPDLWLRLLKEHTAVLRMSISLIGNDMRERTLSGMLHCPIYERHPKKRTELFKTSYDLICDYGSDMYEIQDLLKLFPTITALQSIECNHGRWALIKAFMCAVYGGYIHRPEFLRFWGGYQNVDPQKIMEGTDMSRTQAYRAVATLTDMGIIRNNGTEVWMNYSEHVLRGKGYLVHRTETCESPTIRLKEPTPSSKCTWPRTTQIFVN